MLYRFLTNPRPVWRAVHYQQLLTGSNRTLTPIYIPLLCPHFFSGSLLFVWWAQKSNRKPKPKIKEVRKIIYINGSQSRRNTKWSWEAPGGWPQEPFAEWCSLPGIDILHAIKERPRKIEHLWALKPLFDEFHLSIFHFWFVNMLFFFFGFDFVVCFGDQCLPKRAWAHEGA